MFNLNEYTCWSMDMGRDKNPKMTIFSTIFEVFVLPNTTRYAMKFFCPPTQLRGGVKKNWFFMTFSQKTETPPPPFLTTSVFSDKDFFDSAQTPPPFRRKMVKKLPGFLYKTPISWQIMPKNLIKPFWIG